MKIKLILIVLLLNSCIYSNHCNNKKVIKNAGYIKIFLKMENEVFKLNDTNCIRAKISILNKYGDIIFPKYLLILYNNFGADIEYYFQKKNDKNVYYDIELEITDLNFLLLPKDTITFKYNDTKTITDCLDILYVFTIGEYKVKAVLYLNNYNKSKKIESDWYEFKITN